MYAKEIKLTEIGRQRLSDQVEEKQTEFLISIAIREFLPGPERIDSSSGPGGTVVVHFNWQWKPLNTLGERLSLSARSSGDRIHFGNATFVSGGDR